MSTTLFGVHTQNELVAALAVIAQQNGSGGAWQIVLTGDIDLAGSLTIQLGADSARLTITTAGYVIAGTGTLAVAGRGTLVMDGNNTFTGGVEFASGTLDLATRGGAGSGRIHLAGGTDGTPQILRVHGTAMPINPIRIEYDGGMTNGRPWAYAAVDLVDIAATAQYTGFSDDGSISIPTAAGPVQLTFSAGRSIGFRGGSRVSLLPDGAGGTMLMSLGLFPDPAVTVLGAGGAVIATGFDDLLRNATVQSLANAISAGVIAGRVTPIDNAAGILQGVAGGTIEALVHQAVAVALPDAPAVLFSDAPTAPVVFGGAVDGQLILAGAAGITFAAGTGAGSVLSGAGNSLVNIPLGNAGEYIDLGAGDDTVVTPGGNNTISAGMGRNMLWLGAGGSLVVAKGNDTIVGGTGNAAIDATQGVIPANVLAWFGPGGTQFVGGAGRSTVIGGTGSDTISTAAGASLLWLGSGGDQVLSAGADTIIGGVGAATVTALRALTYGGTGTLNFVAFPANTDSQAANTVVGGAGAATVTGAELVFAGTGPVEINPSPGHATTVVGGSGPLAVNGAALVFAGSGATTVGSAAVVVAGTGTLLFAGTGGTVLSNPAGASTIASTGRTGTFLLYADGDTSFSSDKAPYDIAATATPPYYLSARLAGVDTIIGIGGHLSVPFATAALIFAPATGGSSITVGGQSTVVGGGSGDLVTAIDDGVLQPYSVSYYQPPYSHYGSFTAAYTAPAPVLLAAGPGAETVSAAGFRGDATIIGGSGPDLLIAGNGNTNLFAGTGPATLVGGTPLTYYSAVQTVTTGTTFILTAGSANEIRIENFLSGPDFISLAGFLTGEADAALAGATIQGGDTLLTLSDGTHITFAGFTGLAATDFI